MKHIQLYENFQEGPMKKPQGFFSKVAQGAKHAMGFENKEDRASLETLKNAFPGAPRYGWVKNVREIKPGVVVAYIADNSVIVDINLPEILYKGKELDIANIQDEANFLYNTLLQYAEDNTRWVDKEHGIKYAD